MFIALPYGFLNFCISCYVSFFIYFVYLGYLSFLFDEPGLRFVNPVYSFKEPGLGFIDFFLFFLKKSVLFLL